MSTITARTSYPIDGGCLPAAVTAVQAAALTRLDRFNRASDEGRYSLPGCNR